MVTKVDHDNHHSMVTIVVTIVVTMMVTIRDKAHLTVIFLNSSHSRKKPAHIGLMGRGQLTTTLQFKISFAFLLNKS